MNSGHIRLGRVNVINVTGQGHLVKRRICINVNLKNKLLQKNNIRY